MEPRPLAHFATSIEGELRDASPNAVVRRVSTDSRDIQRGDLFVALTGERFDGHDFAADAVRRGAVAALVARRREAEFEGVPRMLVTDPRRAFGQIAAAYRAQFRLPVVAVGGSNGKTTTKELIGAILGGCFHTLCSRESYNNDVGVPATLLDLENRHVAAVIEVGTNHPGELAPLVRMAQPRMGVITHIGEEHLEYFGSLAGVMEEEGWLADLLPPDGVLILPGDAPWSTTLQARTRARTVRVGTTPGCAWQLGECRLDAEGTTFSVVGPRPELSGEYRVNLLGRHQVFNALLAAAVGAEFGLDGEEIRRGLARCAAPRWRMNRRQWAGVEIIEDCYNANLDSLLAALDTLAAFPCRGRRILVLGGMAELGVHTARAHVTAGRRLAEIGVDHLVTVGETAAISADSAVAAGMARVDRVASVEAAAARLRNWLRPGDCLLVKGSRSARLERLGRLLSDEGCLQNAA